MNGGGVTTRPRKRDRRTGTGIRVDKKPGKGSHRTVCCGAAKTALRDLRKPPPTGT